MKQKKICGNCGKVFYCNQECGLSKSQDTDGCYCSKDYIKAFCPNGEKDIEFKKTTQFLREVCESRFPDNKPEKVSFT